MHRYNTPQGTQPTHHTTPGSYASHPNHPTSAHGTTGINHGSGHHPHMPPHMPPYGYHAHYPMYAIPTAASGPYATPVYPVEMGMYPNMYTNYSYPKPPQMPAMTTQANATTASTTPTSSTAPSTVTTTDGVPVKPDALNTTSTAAAGASAGTAAGASSYTAKPIPPTTATPESGIPKQPQSLAAGTSASSGVSQSATSTLSTLAGPTTTTTITPSTTTSVGSGPLSTLSTSVPAPVAPTTVGTSAATTSVTSSPALAAPTAAATTLPSTADASASTPETQGQMQLPKSPEIGDRVTLITVSGVRYEGKLERIDVVEQSLALAQVRCFGTEDRPVAEKVAPLDMTWKLMVFRGASIAYITIIPTTATVPADPAIVSAQLDDPAISSAVPDDDDTPASGFNASSSQSGQKSRGRKAAQTTHKIVLDGQYDFEEANRRYEEIRLRAGDPARLGSAAAAAADDGQEGGDGPDVAAVAATTKAYDKSKSFFDGLTTGTSFTGYRHNNNRDTFGEAVNEYQSERRRENMERRNRTQGHGHGRGHDHGHSNTHGRGGRNNAGGGYQSQRSSHSSGPETAWRADSSNNNRREWRTNDNSHGSNRGGQQNGNWRSNRGNSGNNRNDGNDYSQSSSDYNSAYSGRRN